MLEIGIEPAIQNGIGDCAQHGEAVHRKKQQVFCVWRYPVFYVINVSDITNCKMNRNYDAIICIFTLFSLKSCTTVHFTVRHYIFQHPTFCKY